MTTETQAWMDGAECFASGGPDPESGAGGDAHSLEHGGTMGTLKS